MQTNQLGDPPRSIPGVFCAATDPANPLTHGAGPADNERPEPPKTTAKKKPAKRATKARKPSRIIKKKTAEKQPPGRTKKIDPDKIKAYRQKKAAEKKAQAKTPPPPAKPAPKTPAKLTLKGAPKPPPAKPAKPAPKTPAKLTPEMDLFTKGLPPEMTPAALIAPHSETLTLPQFMHIQLNIYQHVEAVAKVFSYKPLAAAIGAKSAAFTHKKNKFRTKFNKPEISVLADLCYALYNVAMQHDIPIASVPEVPTLPGI